MGHVDFKLILGILGNDYLPSFFVSHVCLLHVHVPLHCLYDGARNVQHAKSMISFRDQGDLLHLHLNFSYRALYHVCHLAQINIQFRVLELLDLSTLFLGGLCCVCPGNITAICLFTSPM